MKYLLLSAFCLSASIGFSQKTVDVSKNDGMPQNAFFSVGGEPFVNVKFVRLVEGTPYFKDEWLKGSGISGNGVSYKAGVLKLDLIENQVHYLDASGKEMIATSPLKELWLNDTVSGESWHFIHSSQFQGQAVKKGWYLKLAAGKAGIYQYFSKILTERTPYGSATAEQIINTKDEFYLYNNATLTQVKKAKDLISLLADKQKELEEHLKNNIKEKSTAAQLSALVEFYNQQ